MPYLVLFKLETLWQCPGDAINLLSASVQYTYCSICMQSTNFCLEVRIVSDTSASAGESTEDSFDEPAPALEARVGDFTTSNASGSLVSAVVCEVRGRNMYI